VLRFLIRRLFTSLVTMLLVVTAMFVLTRSFGDPRNVYVGDAFNENISQERWDALGVSLGIDKPIYVQYARYVGRLAVGDLGESIHQRRPVQELILERMPATAKLALGGFLFMLLMGIPLGVLAAVSRGGPWDYLSRLIAIFGHSAPSFWIAILLVFFFGVKLGWLPTFGSGGIKHYILPSITLGLGSASGMLRIVRSSMLEVLDSEYVKMARAKGVSRKWVLWKHALRNAMISPLTVAGLTLGSLITGSVLIEVVFAWPGLGTLSLTSVFNADFTTVQGVFLVVTLFYVTTSFLVDILYALVDPRIRFS
jgi:peptide/nickel transport system permease protein